jgi:TM2 domain-containing membrane protein YozV
MSESSISPELAPPPPPPAGAATPRRSLKNPWVSLVLSFVFPGVGQVYNGQPAKALVFFLAFTGAIYGVTEIGPFPFALLIPFVYLFNLVDAYRGAVLGGDRGTETIEDVAESPAWGASLVVLGGLLLLHNLGWLHLGSLARFWPVLLIAAGFAFLRGALQRRKAA